ncbi:MAG TPA: beta-galactosidase [Bacillota bacterium]|nr:beta-galactosidase [Bacillota bacterium]
MRHYTITLEDTSKQIYSGHLKLGAQNSGGDRLSINNYYLELNGRPFFGIAGEFHYSRYPSSDWEKELLKMRAAGINIVSTYIFWNHHEEEEGVFRWDGDRNIRRFVDLCAKCDLYVILRIGPFCHGEVRNGGFPDWLYGRPFKLRSNDQAYIYYVKRLYQEIGKQVTGLLFQDNGPIIGIQLENEYMHASAPWEFMVTQEVEWVGSGTEGADHLKALKDLAQEAGLRPPFYTCTAWNGAVFLEDESLPLYGGYAFQPWTMIYSKEKTTVHAPTGEFLLQHFHDRSSIWPGFNPGYDPERYPYACGELGAGMACWYNYRFQIPAEMAAAVTLVKIAGGCNFLGYYMFHDGTNPVGKQGFLNERVVPKLSYNFQAPVGEYGQIRDSYKYLKPIIYFLQEFGELLCPMATAIPPGVEKITPDNNEDLRYAIRYRENSGFIFLVNYQDHFRMKDLDNISITIKLPGESITLPGEGAFSIKKNGLAILPFNLWLESILLKTATAQLMTRCPDKEGFTYFFFTPAGMKGQYCFDSSGIKGVDVQNGSCIQKNEEIYILVTPGTDCLISLTGANDQRIRICTLTQEQALHFWKFDLWGQERVLISGADIIVNDGYIELSRIGDPNLDFQIYPPVGKELLSDAGQLKGREESIFETFETRLPEKVIEVELRLVDQDKATVQFPGAPFTGVNEIYLEVDYLGNVGYAFCDGVLISDNFCNGEPWEIGLKRFGSRVLEQGMYFYILPYREGSEVIFDRDIEFRHDFSSDRIAQIYSIKAIPEYKMILSIMSDNRNN